MPPGLPAVPTLDEPEAPKADDFICIARIARPQGIRGEVIADLLTDFPERFAKLGSARIKKPNGEIIILRLESSRPHKGRMLLKFAGYDTMNAADELRDSRLMITRDQLVKLPKDTFFDFDLIDCEVITVGGQAVGWVKRVQSFGAAPLLVVEGGEREHLIPLASSICIEVDIANKRIVIDPPEGLLEL